MFCSLYISDKKHNKKQKATTMPTIDSNLLHEQKKDTEDIILGNSLKQEKQSKVINKTNSCLQNDEVFPVWEFFYFFFNWVKAIPEMILRVGCMGGNYFFLLAIRGVFVTFCIKFQFFGCNFTICWQIFQIILYLNGFSQGLDINHLFAELKFFSIIIAVYTCLADGHFTIQTIQKLCTISPVWLKSDHSQWLSARSSDSEVEIHGFKSPPNQWFTANLLPN